MKPLAIVIIIIILFVVVFLLLPYRTWSIMKLIKSKFPTRIDNIKLIVDYTRTIEQAIADGRYNSESDKITAENFFIPSKMTGKKIDIVGKLFNFNRAISSEDVVSEMDQAGFRPATLMELLALGATHPELQREFTIIALGSVWYDLGDYRQVPSLGASGDVRELYLCLFHGLWIARCRFFGIRK